MSHGHIRSRATMDTTTPANLPTPVVYKEEFEQFGHVAHGFHLSAFKAGTVFPLEAAAHDMATLIADVNDNASRAMPQQLQKHADDNGLDINELMRPTGSDLLVCTKFERTAEATGTAGAEG